MAKWLDIMTTDEIRMIHDNSLRILAEIGIRIPNTEVLRRCRELGGLVDTEHPILKIPAKVMEDFLVKVRGQNEYNYRDARLEKIRGGVSTQTYIFDYRGGTRRLGVMDDIYKGIRLLESMENFSGTAAVVVPSDVPKNLTDVESFYAMYAYASKEGSTYILSPESAGYIVEMSKVLGRSCGYLLETVSPLQFRKESLEIALKMVEMGCSLWGGPMVIGGATGPMTIAGNCSLQNAEILGSMFVSCALNGSYGFGYGSGNHTMDMRTMLCSFGSPNQAMLGMAAAQMGRFYGLWSVSNNGLTDSLVPDFQFGAEKAVSSVLTLLAGGGGMGGQGIVGADQGISLEQIVLDNEYIGFYNYIASGISRLEVSEETLAYDVLKEVGIGGSFIAEEHTVRHLGDSYFGSSIFERTAYDPWVSDGRRSALERASEKVSDLTAGYEKMEPILSASKLEDLTRIREEARISIQA